MGNGIAERFYLTLINMLGTLKSNQKVDWKSYICSIVHADNCSKYDTTGFSPYFFMFRCHPRIGVDLALSQSVLLYISTHYFSILRDRFKAAYEVAEAYSRLNQSSQRMCYDQHVRSAVLAPSDQVLVKKIGLKEIQNWQIGEVKKHV